MTTYEEQIAELKAQLRAARADLRAAGLSEIVADRDSWIEQCEWAREMALAENKRRQEAERALARMREALEAIRRECEESSDSEQVYRIARIARYALSALMDGTNPVKRTARPTGASVIWGNQGPNDPVHFDIGQQKWYFYEETWADRQGPFDTEEQARAACRKYAEAL